jgi:hypothetical protein
VLSDDEAKMGKLRDPVPLFVGNLIAWLLNLVGSVAVLLLYLVGNVDVLLLYPTGVITLCIHANLDQSRRKLVQHETGITDVAVAKM